MNEERNGIINDIVLWAENDEYIYTYLIDACALVARKKKKRNYTQEKALPAFRKVIKFAMKSAFYSYYKDCGVDKWYKILTPAEREVATLKLLNSSTDLIESIEENGISAKNFLTYIYDRETRKCLKRSVFYLPGGEPANEESYKNK